MLILCPHCKRTFRHVKPKAKGTMRERFFSFVYEAPNGCHLWMGGLGKNDYPHFNYGGKTLNAHRVAWEIAHNKKLPPGVDVHHCCPGIPNPSCVNPEHLEAVPHLKHMRFGWQNGHRPRVFGEHVHTAKLKEPQVIEIRRQSAEGVSDKTLAAQYDMSQTTIHNIVLRKIWKHLS